MKGTPITVALVSLLFLAPGWALSGDEKKTADADISVGVGLERLDYRESEPTTALHSRGSTYNVTAQIEATKRWRTLFVGFCGTYPLVAGKDDESWSAAGGPFQTNELTYRWTRISGYFGYPINPLAIPIVGLRYSRSSQTRGDFIVSGSPVTASAKEKVVSTGILFGLRGQGNISAGFRWSYGLTLTLPVHVDVTNSSLPGFKADETKGYGYELNLGILRWYSDQVGYGLFLKGGRVHWEGSDFLPFAGGFAKWPENDTRYLGAAVTLHLLL